MKNLPPAQNKFHVGNGDDGKHYWLTPPDLYAELNAEFQFDFDPCPCPKPADFDGLTCEWGKRNWVNPPFGSIIHQGKKKGPTAWMRKAIEEQKKGKLSVVVYPIDKWVLMMLKATGSVKVRNLGDVRWHAVEDGIQGKGTGRHIAAFILEPHEQPQDSASVENGGGLSSPPPSGRLGVLTDVETELRKMQRQLAGAGVVNGAKVLELAADIVAMSGRQAVALRDATTLIGEIMRDEVNAQDECEKWLRAYGPNEKAQQPRERQ